jgi:hypothetical protein
VTSQRRAIDQLEQPFTGPALFSLLPFHVLHGFDDGSGLSFVLHQRANIDGFVGATVSATTQATHLRAKEQTAQSAFGRRGAMCLCHATHRRVSGSEQSAQNDRENPYESRSVQR